MIENNSIGKATILIVEDSHDDIILMSNMLKGLYNVKIAESGEMAMKIALSESPPDLILLDIMMATMDGYEVCWRLKHDHKTLNIPVIFITGKTDEADEKKGLELGAVDFIIKPINPEIILARVKNHLALKLKTDRIQEQNDNLEIEVSKLKTLNP